ncbi:MAG: OmpA family protein [Magnetococcales bacterium]|nr:OmpA family protein [Magnetococcales bacterium]MBF0322252.1 OmpA family protein [Magnetococcales bacterium]
MFKAVCLPKVRAVVWGGALIVAAASVCICGNRALAGDVVSLQGKEPSATDIVEGLLGAGSRENGAGEGKVGSRPKVKTRGIVFDGAGASPPKAEHKAVSESAGKAAAKAADQEDRASTHSATGGECPKGNAVALSVPFEFNSYQLSADASKTLKNVAEAMNSDQLAHCRFAIEGHTDASGSQEYNLRLSAARAKAVRDFLAENVPAQRMSVVGKGPRELLNPDDPTGADNRRVQFRLTGSM